MENSGFVVINATHNIGHSESVLLVFSLSVLLVVAAIFVAGTHGWPKFHF